MNFLNKAIHMCYERFAGGGVDLGKDKSDRGKKRKERNEIIPLQLSKPKTYQYCAISHNDNEIEINSPKEPNNDMERSMPIQTLFSNSKDIKGTIRRQQVSNYPPHTTSVNFQVKRTKKRNTNTIFPFTSDSKSSGSFSIPSIKCRRTKNSKFNNVQKHRRISLEIKSIESPGQLSKKSSSFSYANKSSQKLCTIDVPKSNRKPQLPLDTSQNRSKEQKVKESRITEEDKQEIQLEEKNISSDNSEGGLFSIKVIDVGCNDGLEKSNVRFGEIPNHRRILMTKSKTKISELSLESTLITNSRQIKKKDRFPTSNRNPYKKRLVRFYKKHNPSKLPYVNGLLRSYVGEENILFEKLILKYKFTNNGKEKGYHCNDNCTNNNNSFNIKSKRKNNRNTFVSSSSIFSFKTGEIPKYYPSVISSLPLDRRLERPLNRRLESQQKVFKRELSFRLNSSSQSSSGPCTKKSMRKIRVRKSLS